MAKQEAKTVNTLTRIETKVPVEKKPRYSEAEMKKVGSGYDYDKIAFTNKTIDNLRSRTNAMFAAHTDIVPLTSPEAQAMIPKKAGKDAWVAEGGYYEPNKRNQNLKNTFEAVSPLTGQVGMSRSQYKANAADIEKYRKDENADTNVRFKRKK
jgi:hypothetical protein